MVVPGFTVAFACRRQVPNTCGAFTLLPFAMSSLGNVDLRPMLAVRQRTASVLACVAGLIDLQGPELPSLQHLGFSGSARSNELFSVLFACVGTSETTTSA